MKAFLWGGIAQVSDSYHAGGSVLVEAETIEQARKLCKRHNPEINDVSGEPDLILESHSTVEAVWTFPDAGCC